MSIHPSAVISPEAKIANDVYIGPFCVIIGNVTLGSGCRLENHVTLGSPTGIVEIGQKNTFLAGCAVGGPPQDLSYKGDPTKLVIGDNNVIRECATINIGTVKGGGVTKIGSQCLIMAYCHVGHDSHIGDRVVIANSTQLAGHVTIEDDVKIGGVCAFNQFVRIGSHAYIAGDSAVNKDIAPYTQAQGKYAVMRAANHIGLERAGYAKEDIASVRRAIRFLIKGNLTVEEVLAKIAAECPSNVLVDHFVEFIKKSERGLAR